MTCDSNSSASQELIRSTWKLGAQLQDVCEAETQRGQARLTLDSTLVCFPTYTSSKYMYAFWTRNQPCFHLQCCTAQSMSVKTTDAHPPLVQCSSATPDHRRYLQLLRLRWPQLSRRLRPLLRIDRPAPQLTPYISLPQQPLSRLPNSLAYLHAQHMRLLLYQHAQHELPQLAHH